MVTIIENNYNQMIIILVAVAILLLSIGATACPCISSCHENPNKQSTITSQQKDNLICCESPKKKNDSNNTNFLGVDSELTSHQCTCIDKPQNIRAKLSHEDNRALNRVNNYNWNIFSSALLRQNVLLESILNTKFLKITYQIFFQHPPSFLLYNSLLN